MLAAVSRQRRVITLQVQLELGGEVEVRQEVESRGSIPVILQSNAAVVE